MSILLGKEIYSAYRTGEILIDPFYQSQISVNSYDVRLSNKIVTYAPLREENYEGQKIFVPEYTPVLSMRSDNKVFEYTIPEEGVILSPGVLYLGSTVEKIGSRKFIPMYEGRSSMARLGIQSHISAGFGDAGFESNWTLEITVVHPVKFYPNVRIGQVFFHRPGVEILPEDLYKGKYRNQTSPTPSKAFKDFERSLS